jgi:hypothetical protein
MENRDRDKLSQSSHSTPSGKVNRDVSSESSLNESSRRSGSGSMESGSGRSSGSSGISDSKKKSDIGSNE